MKKLASPTYRLGGELLRPEHVHTAAEAQVRFMIDRVGPGSKVFVLSGGDHFWLRCARTAPAASLRTRAAHVGGWYAV
eukprot:5667916-Prymnesium_polylepis.1